MTGPWWESGQGVHSMVRVEPAVMEALSWPGVAPLWQMKSAVEKAEGAMKPLSRSVGMDQPTTEGMGDAHWNDGLYPT
jgi:hypothetical protein